MTPELDHPNGLPRLPREIPHSMDFSQPIQEPAPAAEAKANSIDLGEILSPSQCATYLQCPARWWYKYGLEIPVKKSSNLTLGTCLHSAVAANYREKIESKQDLPVAGVLGLFHNAWAEHEDETDWQPDEIREEVKLMGVNLVTKYMDAVAPHVEPAAVELPVAGEIGGVSVRGFVDLVDVTGRIIDLKSANKTPSDIPGPYRFQTTTYTQITPGASGEVRLDTIVKLKREIKVVRHEFAVNDADRKHTAAMYPLVQAGMRAGIYTPNRSNFLCSRRYCGYWQVCEGDFGGAVKGGEE